MKNTLYNKKHAREYVLYGLFSGILYVVPAWIFFMYMDYEKLWIIFAGPVLFMFAIMQYVIRLSRRRPEYKSAWMMIVAAHMAVIVGILLSVAFTAILCFIYIPGFLSGNSDNILDNASGSMNGKNSLLLTLLFLCATVANFGAAGFMAVLGPYVFKQNQTKDRSVMLEKEIDPGKTRNENKPGL